MTTVGRALRLAAGGALSWWVMAAVIAPELSLICKVTAVLLLATTAWQPRWGLALTTALAPAGALLAAAPARAAEMFAWAFVAGWLLAGWRPLSRDGWPRTLMMPLTLYAAALIASWLSLTIAGAAGVAPASMPQFIVSLFPVDYFIRSSPEPETWALLQSLAGLAVFAAAADTARSDPRTVRLIGWAIVASMTILAAATVVDVAAAIRTGETSLSRFFRGERFSLPLADVNAAGSLYAMAAVIALAYAWLQRSRTLLWIAVLVVLAPAIWLSGSRSAYLAIAAGAAVLTAVRQQWKPTRGHIVAAVSLFLVAMLAAGIFVDPQSGVEGSAEQSANLRSQFLLTSARMFASEPLFGVGVGRYFQRSAEFMTPELRDLYGNENAHNYFAQQFAELGLIGGVLFVWLVVGLLSRGWPTALRSTEDIAVEALFAGTTAFVLTCATGHPLLVPEAALPFWAAFGAVASATSGQAAAVKPWRRIAIAAGVVLAAGIGRSAMMYSNVTEMPREQGFHQFETTRDGAEFRWMTRHAVTYIPAGPGFLHLRLRAPGWPGPHPVVLETSIGGQVVDRREIPADASTTWDVPARVTAQLPFRRVDFRVNHEWFEEVRLGQRAARRPVSLMVERIDWTGLQ